MISPQMYMKSSIMADVVDHLKYYQAIQMLYVWQTRTMKRARLAEQRTLEGTADTTSEFTRAAYACTLKVITVVRKIMNRIPDLLLDEDTDNKDK